MRALRATLTGELTVGDCIMLHYCAARGGRTTAGHYVVEGDTIASAIEGLVTSAKAYLLSESEAKIKDGALSIITTREDGEWLTEVLGAKTEFFTIKEVG